MSCEGCKEGSTYGPFTSDLYDQATGQPFDHGSDYSKQPHAYSVAPPTTPPANYASVDRTMVENSIDYQLHKGLGNQTIYWAGREVAVGQERQPSGLGGYTNTRNFIMLAPDDQIREDFEGHDVDLDQHGVFYHEKRHFDDEDGGHDEYHNRWKEWADKHLWKLKFDPAALDSVDISYEGELPKKSDNSSVSYTIY